MKLKIYEKETTKNSITVSVAEIPDDNGISKIKFEVSNAYDFVLEQCVFENGESKKVILNGLMPGTRYRIYGYVFEDGEYTEIGSDAATTVSNENTVTAIKPSGALS